MPWIIQFIGLRNLIAAGVLAGLLVGIWVWAYQHGRQSRQPEIDALNKQISDYQLLGKNMKELQTELQAKINSGNEEIRKEIAGNHQSIDAGAKEAQASITGTIAALKKDAERLKVLREKLRTLPEGPARDDLQRLIDALTTRQPAVECLSTPVPEELVLKLKQTYALGKL